MAIEILKIILSFILKFGVLGFACYLVHNVFSKDTKEFNCTVDQNDIRISTKYFKK